MREDGQLGGVVQLSATGPDGAQGAGGREPQLCQDLSFGPGKCIKSGHTGAMKEESRWGNNRQEGGQ